MVHVELDKLCSADPVFKKQLEWLADRDTEQRKRLKRKKGKSNKNENPYADDFKKFEDSLRKMVEIQRLVRLLYS